MSEDLLADVCQRMRRTLYEHLDAAVLEAIAKGWHGNIYGYVRFDGGQVTVVVSPEPPKPPLDSHAIVVQVGDSLRVMKRERDV